MEFDIKKLAQERLERERKKQEEKVAQPTETEIVYKPHSILKELEKERRKRRLTPERINARNAAIKRINQDIVPFISENLDRLENYSLLFSQEADVNNTTAIVEILEKIETNIRELSNYLKEFNQIIDQIVEETGHIEDGEYVIKETLNPTAVKVKIHEGLDILRGISEAILFIDKSKAGAGKPIFLLNKIFKIAEQSFEYPHIEIVIENDVSKDEMIARELQESLSGYTPAFEPIYKPPISHISSSFRKLPITEGGEDPLGIMAARRIVENNIETDISTLRAILELQGFTEAIIDKVINEVQSKKNDLYQLHLAV